MIFQLLCLLLSAAFFMLMIWPFGPPPPQSPLQWRPHKKLCSNWSAGLSTGAFLSIQANVRPPSSQWIPTKQPPPTQLPPLFQSHSNLSWSTFDHTLSFSKHVSLLKAKFFPRLKALHCISASSWSPSLFCIKLFFSHFSLMPHPNGFLS